MEKCRAIRLKSEITDKYVQTGNWAEFFKLFGCLLNEKQELNKSETMVRRTLKIEPLAAARTLYALSKFSKIFRQWEKAVGVYRRMLDDKTKDPAVEITLKNILAIPLVELGEYDGKSPKR